MKVLVVRFSSIGDIVLTTPVLRCLKQQMGAAVHVVTKKPFQQLLVPNPHVDQLHVFERDIAECLPALKAERFDHVVDLHHNLRSFRLRLALGRPATRFQKLNWEKWLMVRLKIDRLPKRHIVHRYMEAVAGLGVRYDGAGLDHFIPADQEVNPGAFELPPDFLAFAIGANHRTKRLPTERIVEICRRLRTPVALLGGPSEQAEGELIRMAVPDQVVNTCGALSLHGSASLIRQSRAVITHDTGMMHIAAALHKPIYAIWGNTVPAFGMYPFYPDGMDANTTLEVTGLPCRPCSKIGFAQCPQGHFKCMLDQDLGVLSGL